MVRTPLRRSERLPGQLLNRKTMRWEYPTSYKGERGVTVKAPVKAVSLKIQKAIDDRIKASGGSLKSVKAKVGVSIKPKAPAIISQQINKTKRIPYIIGGVLIAVYVLFRKGMKGGKN